MIGNEKNALDYAKMGADTLIRQFPIGELPPKNTFCHHQGVFLAGMERIYLLSGDKKYYDYIKDWVDFCIDENGSVRFFEKAEQFDHMQPSILLFNLYNETRDERYKKVLDGFAPIVEMWPTNAKGGFWHKFDMPNQMRLDLLYMIGPYSAMYAHHFGKPYFYEKIYQQMNLMRRKMTDPKTGLIFHAWDDSRTMEWADKETGLSPELWGRAMGWYATAIMQILDYIPAGHPRQYEFITAARDSINALLRFQDEETGLWFQIVDKGDKTGNWLETSCSLLNTYAVAKAVKTGLVHKSYARHIRRAYEGIIKSLRLDGSNLFVPNLCLSSDVGDYEYYINRPKAENDLLGTGTFLLMCTEYHDALRQH
jgi:unsaturated rhamnogalacturonyl hydrolase